MQPIVPSGLAFGQTLFAPMRAWIAFALTAVYQPRLLHSWYPLDIFLTALVAAWLAGFQ